MQQASPTTVMPTARACAVRWPIPSETPVQPDLEGRNAHRQGRLARIEERGSGCTQKGGGRADFR